MRYLEAERVLKFVHDSTDHRFVMIKGLGLAALYPDPSLRHFGDVDLLSASAVDAQHDLLAAGWESKPTPGFDVDPTRNDELHQLCPLTYPGVPLPLEVHRHPNWPRWSDPPPAQTFFADACPITGLVRISAPSVEHHALIVLAHACARASPSSDSANWWISRCSWSGRT